MKTTSGRHGSTPFYCIRTWYEAITFCWTVNQVHKSLPVILMYLKRGFRNNPDRDWMGEGEEEVAVS